MPEPSPEHLIEPDGELLRRSRAGEGDSGQEACDRRAEPGVHRADGGASRHHDAPSFRRFLRDFGSLVVAGQEFYGEIQRAPYGGGLPSFVWATETARARGDALPTDLVGRPSGYVDLSRVCAAPLTTHPVAKESKDGITTD